ncbi:MAG: hypothetical protein IMZ74_02780 [Actinobacteria bacterium]|nr:hypothetical protein [Actinomycetota bacterium]
MTARRIIRTYLGIAASTTLAQSLIWGVNTLFLLSVGVSTAAVVGAALVQQFWVAVPLYLVSTAAFGVYMPVKQGWLNARIPSEERATIISLDALFGDGGMTVGQVGLGYLSQVVSIPAAWLVGGLTQAAALPLLARARRAEPAEPADAAARAA